MLDARPEELRQEYESENRAQHYRENRWTRSPRARRTDAKEQAIVESFVQHAATMMPAESPISRVLDLPCGTGRFRKLLERNCKDVWSGDASREMLMQAPPSTGLQMSAHAIPLVEESVDLILCSRLLHHFEHPQQRLAVLQELARVSQRWTILSYFDSANFQAWRNKLRGKFRGRFPIPQTTFQSEIQSAGWAERKRVYIARGVSEQVWVLLEKRDTESMPFMSKPEILAQSRTVQVERLSRSNHGEVVRKTYHFPTAKDRMRGMLRGTLFGWNKARREYQNLKFLERANMPVVEALEWTCKRNRLGFVTTCGLITRAYPGRDLAQHLQQGKELSAAFWITIGQSMRQMHNAGFWHRGLSARNVMIGVESPNIAWLDATKSKTYPAGGLPHEKRGFDLLRFWTPLQNRTTQESKTAWAEAYGENLDLEKWWSWIPNWKQASFRRELQREEARFEEADSSASK